jgi:hypothetical protein
MKPRARSLVPVLLLVAAAALLGGCLKRKLKPLNPCLVSGVVAEIAVTNIDKVDLLFMVDNSGSMREEQESLREEFPKIIDVLTRGVRANGEMFPPAKDLHLGVVSSDMGLVGIQGIDKCSDLGHDGIMRNTPSPDVAGCQASYPRFLSYVAGVNDQAQTSTDFACIASLGTDGCGFEQQLEAVLKALWPSVDTDPMTGEPIDNRITFLGNAEGFGMLGHGDTDNAGFLRNDPAVGLSLIAIIMVTDEEDCSSKDTIHFIPNPLPEDPLAMQDLNLRCFYNAQNLYPLERYINGYKALRPGNENLVIFGAIVGVPENLVEPEDYAALDWSDDVARESFYENILNDPRMQEVEDPNRAPGQGGNLQPSCQSFNADGTERTRAYPPRRIVQVARGFGANGTVHSICQEDLGPAVDAIIDVIAKQLGAVCLPRPLVRNSDGLVGCNVVWELPPASMAGPNTPTQCGAPGFDFLLPPDQGREAVTDRGGAVCRVAQMRVVGTGDNRDFEPTETDGVVFNEGWYYDDFSDAVETECPGETQQRVAFTPAAKPPTGVTVKLECLNETQSLAQNRTDIATGIEQPKIGDPCEEVVRNGQTLMDDAACLVRLADGTMDDGMICHPELNVCVLKCDTTFDCPAAWVCDERPETLAATSPDGTGNGPAICVNPTCGDASE